MYARHVLIDKDGHPIGQPTIAPIDLEQTTIQDIAYQLRKELETEGSVGPSVDYCSVSSALDYTTVKGRMVANPGRRNQPIGTYRWIACYAVTGGSEGHYIHVDRIWDEGADRHLENLITIKTFGGYDEACAIAAYVGRRLDV